MDFMECSICAAKQGSPTLCSCCLHNRAVVSNLNKRLRTVRTNAKNWQNLALQYKREIGRLQREPIRDGRE